MGPGKPAKDGRVFFDHAHTGWESFGIVCAMDKDVEAAGVAHELGAEIDGELGKVSGGTARLWKTAVCSLAVALLSKRLTSRRVQVLGGRWAFIAQFRRPLFAVFSDLWQAAVPGCSLAARACWVGAGNGSFAEPFGVVQPSKNIALRGCGH